MTDTRSQDPRRRPIAVDHRTPLGPESGPIEVVASETFGWIHPDVADRPLIRRRDRSRLTTIGVLAVVLSAVGVIVSWLGPWGAGFGLVGAMLGVSFLVRRSQPTAWAWTAVSAGAVSIAFSAYWVMWIMARLTPAAA